MVQARILVIGLLLWADPALGVELAGSGTLATEWMDRGVSQTAGNPAVQAGLEISAETGTYLGLWGSNVDFGDCCSETTQFDLSLGIAREIREIAWDAGLTWSVFPGTTENLDFVEYQLGLGWRSYGLAVAWTPDFASLGRELWYYELSGDFELPWQRLRLLLHAGYTRGSALHQRFTEQTGLEPYGDWQIALARDVRRFRATLGWADTDMGGDFRNRGRVERNDGQLFFELTAAIR